jgi:hypothetical protein
MEIALYFELQKKEKFVAMHRDKLLLEICLFIAQAIAYFSQNFYRIFGCQYVCVYLISIFGILEICFSKNSV